MKRLLGVFQIALPMMRDEVDWPDILGFIALEHKRNKFVKRIRQQPSHFVGDPWAPMSIEEARRPQKLEEFFNTTDQKDPVGMRFARFLFPDVPADDPMARPLNTGEDDPHPDRICFRYPLEAVLRLGRVESYPSNAKSARCWAIPATPWLWRCGAPLLTVRWID